jgi:ParB-like chromosome segregation protein Spo0J
MDSSPDPSTMQNDQSVTPKHYDAFISYSRKNEDFAAKLEQALENYRPPKDVEAPQRRLNIFRDKHDFRVGDYQRILENSLMASAKLIVICSPEARSSQFVNEEIRMFAALNAGKNVIPVLHSGIPNNEAGPEQAELMAFPAALCELMEMPLAANFLKFDSQKSKVNRDPYSDAWYTILADIYDVSRDEIEQRDRRRRNRTLRMALVGLTGAIGVLSLLLVFAVISRQQAIDARKDAVDQAKEATKQRGIAEGKTREAKRERDNALKAQKAEKKQRQEADRQRTNAERQTMIATAQKNKAILAQAAEKRQRKTAEHQTQLALLREQIALVSGLLPTVEAAEEMIRSIALFPASQQVSGMAMAGQATLLSAVQTAQEIDRIQDPHLFWSVVFSPDGRLIGDS